ncbi:SsrA-binding protein SmpB [Guggenheimella bovis]
MKNLATNKKAYHDYFILKTFEAGLSLVGSEVKSMKDGKVSIKEAFIEIRQDEAYITGMHVSPYEQSSIFNVDSTRDRKLLLHKREIHSLYEEVKKQGITVVPLKVYVNDRNLIKLEIGLAQGKKLYDKRESLKEKEAKRAMDRALKNY